VFLAHQEPICDAINIKNTRIPHPQAAQLKGGKAGVKFHWYGQICLILAPANDYNSGLSE
jgi:hypothetical protein